MTKYLPYTLWLVLVFTSCGSTHNASNESSSKQSRNNHEAISSSFDDVDTSHFVQNHLVGAQNPLPLTNLSRTEEGAYVLAPGFYETEFKTYCLQPGTPDPTSSDAYFRAPLTGNRKEIIETILRNSQQKPYLEQRNVQLLLWSVVSKSNFDNLSYPVQSTARELLTPKQIFELKGGTMGVVKTVVKASGITSANGDISRLFDMGTSSYEAYENLAVLRVPSQSKRPDFKRDQWYKQEEGYYVRYFPSGYRNTRIQVYVPNDLLDSTNKKAGEYLVFDPTSKVIVPAYSNAQRLGIGGAVVEVIKEVIKIEKKMPPPAPRKLPESKPKPTKPQV